MSFFFLFQAEDGIRDLVRSRGLGDVYKRQRQRGQSPPVWFVVGVENHEPSPALWVEDVGAQSPVSYTHLTLPTSDLV